MIMQGLADFKFISFCQEVVKACKENECRLTAILNIHNDEWWLNSSDFYLENISLG
jgi:hypothetical protein